MARTFNRNINDLHPVMRDPVRKLEGKLLDDRILGTDGTTGFRLFEGYRSPDDQEQEFREGNSKAHAWQSAHQYGLAADYVWWTGTTWSWDIPSYQWLKLEAAAHFAGLSVPIEWDRPHVQHPAFINMKAMVRRV